MFQKINNKSLLLFASVYCFAQQVAMAGPLDSLPNSAHPSATIPEIGNRVEGFLGWFYTIIKMVAIVIGLWMVVSGLLKVKARANGEEQGSIWGAWFGIVVGSMLAGVTTWLWAISKTAEDFAGVSAP